MKKSAGQESLQALRFMVLVVDIYFLMTREEPLLAML